MSSAKATADDALVSGLVGCGWLLDVSTDAALREVSRPLSSLLDLPRSPPVSTVQRWLQQLWRQPPPPTNTPTPDLLRLRSNFSLAVRYCIATVCGKRLDVAEVQLSEREAAQNHAAALSALPGLCLLLSHKPYRTTHGASWVRFPPTSGADPHPLLPDCEAKAPFVSGLPFGWLQVLRHGVVDGGEQQPQQTQQQQVPLSLLQSIDTGLIALLRLPMLSSPGFELSAERVGPPKALPTEVTNRLTDLITLLYEHATECAVDQQQQPTVTRVIGKLVRHTTLRRTFRAPTLPGASSGDDNRSVRQLYALVDDLPQESGNGNGDGGKLRVCVAGEPEDYAADLSDELVTAILPRGCPRPARLLSLLGYIEDGRRF